MQRIGETVNSRTHYTYDAWGNVLSITGSNASVLGANNPIRYRSYYYDFETGFYYLQSGYYDSEIRRFINADDVSLLGANGDFISYNLYSYCLNNPVNRFDDGGNLSLPNWAKKAVAAVAVVAVVATVTAITVATAGAGAALVAAGIGAATGLAGKYVEDVTYNVAKGKTGIEVLKPVSSWQDYTSSAISGSVSNMVGLIAPGSSTVAKNAMDAILKPAVKQNLEIVSGDRQNIDLTSMAKDASLRFVTSSTLKTSVNSFPTPGLNKFMGSLPCSIGRGIIKYTREYFS